MLSLAMDDTDQMQKRLAELRLEHRDLDDVIAQLAQQATSNQLQIRRLKKRKLVIKDQIARLESALWPDIIA